MKPEYYVIYGHDNASGPYDNEHQAMLQAEAITLGDPTYNEVRVVKTVLSVILVPHTTRVERAEGQ